jgi:two-component system LytT family response regulator
MTAVPLRVVVADDERPARAFLLDLLRGCPDVQVVGEASSGLEAVRVIERVHPDLALLDLQMPECDGLTVVRLLRRDTIPLVAFVTAYDDYAVKAFELSAIDYLLKPVEPARLRDTLTRAHERLERANERAHDAERLRRAVAVVDAGGREYLRRVPVRKRDEIILVPVEQVAAITADGELLHLTTRANERYTITYRLKDLEARLDPTRFVRLSRGAIVALDQIQKVSPMPGGTFVVSLMNRQQVPVSRLRARALRDVLFRL